jgi:riboflavin biosynthesis pyrimidine reductase
MSGRFDDYCRQKVRSAVAAAMPGYTTADMRDCAGLVAVGNRWSQQLFDGPFYRSRRPSIEGVPVTSLVFVQSRDGNTGASDPSSLGGGSTDLHLIYEGLSRVDADAVLAGAATARGRNLVFSVWHPELVSLRRARGCARHPAQVVVTGTGDLPFEDGLMFQEPSLRVFVITRTPMVDVVRDRVVRKPWIHVVDAGEPISFTRAFRCLAGSAIRTMSCVGGARTAAALLKERLVTDIYLTTGAERGGTPNTPFYAGPPLSLDRVLLKEGRGPERGVRFEHLTASQSQV